METKPCPELSLFGLRPLLEGMVPPGRAVRIGTNLYVPAGPFREQQELGEKCLLDWLGSLEPCTLSGPV